MFHRGFGAYRLLNGFVATVGCTSRQVVLSLSSTEQKQYVVVFHKASALSGPWAFFPYRRLPFEARVVVHILHETKNKTLCFVKGLGAARFLNGFFYPWLPSATGVAFPILRRLPKQRCSTSFLALIDCSMTMLLGLGRPLRQVLLPLSSTASLSSSVPPRFWHLADSSTTFLPLAALRDSCCSPYRSPRP